MAENLKKGDHVTWNNHGGQAKGTVDRKITSTPRLPAEPSGPASTTRSTRSRSEKSGGTAVHKPAALHKE